jgi:hypothetical protein
MFFPVVACQRLHDGCFAGFDAPVAQLSQPERIAFSGEDGIHNGQASGPRQVADHVVNLQIHLIQSPLHRLQVNGRQLNEILAVPP